MTIVELQEELAKYPDDMRVVGISNTIKHRTIADIAVWTCPDEDAVVIEVW